MNSLLQPPAVSPTNPNLVTSTTSRVAIETIISSDTHRALDEWQRLEDRLANRSLTASVGWINCWLANYGKIVSHHFVLARAGDHAVGMALVTHGVDRKIGPFTLNTVHLGTAGEPPDDTVFVEYNRPLVDPKFSQQFLAALGKHLREQAPCDEVCLDGVEANDLKGLIEQLPDARVETRISRYADLAAFRSSGIEILPHLGSSTRSNIRRRLRDLKEVRVDWAESPAQGQKILDELITLHQARWQAAGKPGAFAGEHFRQFQRDLVTHLLPDRRVALVRVTADNATIGCLMLLIDRNRLLDYLSGFASFESAGSPGLVTHYLCMQQALNRGFDAYDFLVGEHRHKQNLSTTHTELHWVRWARPSLKNTLFSALRTIRNRWHSRNTTGNVQSVNADTTETNRTSASTTSSIVPQQAN